MRSAFTAVRAALSRQPAEQWVFGEEIACLAASDVIDMAAAAPQLSSRDEGVQKANGFAALAIGAVAALDVYCATKLARQ